MARYKDINMLFLKHPVTADVVKLNDEQSIKASIVNLLSTKNYERPFHPEVGCQIWSIIFEPFGPTTRTITEKTIKDVIDKFEPRVTFKEAKVRERIDNNELEIEVTILINSTDKLVKIVTAINRVR